MLEVRAMLTIAPPRIARFLNILLLLAFAVWLVAPALETSAQSGSAAAINSGRLNVRTGPGITFAVVTSLAYNTQVTLIGKASSGTWVQIRISDGRVGWVNSLYLRSYADYNLLPITFDTSIITPPQTVPPPSGPPGTVTYTVRQGDTLQTIARRYSTTWQVIAAANALPNANFVYAGQRLIIPLGVTTPSYPPAPGPNPNPQPSPGTHVVQAGETLAIIAARYGRTVAALVAANNLASADRIFAGQRLVIPSAPAAPRYYTVARGDTLFSIALRYGTTVAAIVAANNLANPNIVNAGTRLLIP